MARIIQPAKVPTWMKDMTLDTFKRQLDIRKSSNADVLESTQFHDLVECLKQNRDVKGLAKYVSKYVPTTLNTAETQKIGEVMECLKTCYVGTRLEKIEELLIKWMNFRYDDFDK